MLSSDLKQRLYLSPSLSLSLPMVWHRARGVPGPPSRKAQRSPPRVHAETSNSVRSAALSAPSNSRKAKRKKTIIGTLGTEANFFLSIVLSVCIICFLYLVVPLWSDQPSGSTKWEPYLSWLSLNVSSTFPLFSCSIFFSLISMWNSFGISYFLFSLFLFLHLVGSLVVNEPFLLSLGVESC